MIKGPPKKIMLLGRMAVGKTSLANRLEFGSFDQEYKSTIGVELRSFDISIDGNLAPIILWDTDGSFGEHIFNSVYLRGAAAAVIVADITRPDTIDDMINLSKMFEEALPGRPSCCLLNKSDLGTAGDEQLKLIKRETDMLHLSSAKTGEGVNEALVDLYSTILNREQAYE